MQSFISDLEPVTSLRQGVLPDLEALFPRITAVTRVPSQAALLGYVVGFSEVVAHVVIAKGRRPKLQNVLAAATRSLVARAIDVRPQVSVLVDAQLARAPHIASRGSPIDMYLHVDVNCLHLAPDLVLNFSGPVAF